MNKNIDRIIAKGKWSGAEVGKLYIKNYVNDIIENAKGNFNNEPLFSQTDFEKMVKSLDTPGKWSAYLAYISIYDYMVDGFNKSQAYTQQFLNGYQSYLLALEHSQEEENHFKSLLKLPAIITQKEYDKLLAKTEQRLESITENGYNILFTTVGLYLELFLVDAKELLPPPVKEALEALQDEPATRESVINHYRHETATPGDAGELNLDKINSRYNKTEEALFKGLPWLISSLKLENEESLERLLKLDADTQEDLLESILTEGEITIAPALEPFKAEIELLKNKLGYNTDLEATLIINPNRSFNKLEILEASFAYYYTKIDRENGGGKSFDKKDLKDILKLNAKDILEAYPVEDAKEQLFKLQEFIEDYPALYKAVIKDLAQRLPGFDKLPTEWLTADLFNYGTLANAGLTVYSERVKPHKENIAVTLLTEGESFYTASRAKINGIAIIQQEETYKEKPFKSIYDTDLHKQEDRDAITKIKEMLIDTALSYLLSYNKLLDILNQVYDIDISIIKVDESYLRERVNSFNGLIYSVYAGYTGCDKEKKEKRKLFKQVFKLISLEDNQPTAEAIATVKEKLEELGTKTLASKELKNMEQFLTILIKSTPAFNGYSLNVLSL